MEQLPAPNTPQMLSVLASEMQCTYMQNRLLPLSNFASPFQSQYTVNALLMPMLGCICSILSQVPHAGSQLEQ